MSEGWRVEGRIPPIKVVMRPFPFSIESGAPIARARALMAEHDIRHLPVHASEPEVEASGRLVGIVSERDLRGQADDRAVEEVMSAPVVQVDMERPLDEALELLAEGRIGSVLVTRGGRVAGIFTTTDACRLLAEAFAPLSTAGGPGDEVA